jgi:hypothetical protein
VEVFGILNFAEGRINSSTSGDDGKNSCCDATQDRATVNPPLTKKHGIAFVFQRHRQGPNDIAPVSCGIMKVWGGRPQRFLN